VLIVSDGLQDDQAGSRGRGRLIDACRVSRAQRSSPTTRVTRERGSSRGRTQEEIRRAEGPGPRQPQVQREESQANTRKGRKREEEVLQGWAASVRVDRTRPRPMHHKEADHRPGPRRKVTTRTRADAILEQGSP